MAALKSREWTTREWTSQHDETRVDINPSFFARTTLFTPAISVSRAESHFLLEFLDMAINVKKSACAEIARVDNAGVDKSTR